MSNIGPHLLGRKPSPPDSRDWQLTSFLGLTDQELRDKAVEELKLTTVGYINKYWTRPPNNTHWFKAMAYLGQITPTPPPPTDTIVWSHGDQVLDQEETPHCVGFDAAAWGNVLPYNDRFTNEDGHKIYYECKVIDGEPGRENGSYIRSGAKALQNRRRLTAYAFATRVEDMIEWVRTKGPIMVGTAWYTGMFYPDDKHYVKATGYMEGGHAYCLIGHSQSEAAFIFLNSWGRSYGNNGIFKMKVADFAPLLADDGEACVALELPL